MKLISVNIEGDKHLDRVMTFFEKEQADVLCLQEVFEKDLFTIKGNRYSYHTFAPMMHIKRNNMVTLKGVAIVSKIKPTTSFLYYYAGSENFIPIGNDDPNNANRVLLVAHFDQDNIPLIISTTHFTWSSDGTATKAQYENLDNLTQILETLKEYILCGDFNAPRNGEIYKRLTQKFTDNIPNSIETTVDPILHRAGPLKLVVDYIFSTPSYFVTDVQVKEGVSDHKAIVCTVEKSNTSY